MHIAVSSELVHLWIWNFVKLSQEKRQVLFNHMELMGSWRGFTCKSKGNKKYFLSHKLECFNFCRNMPSHLFPLHIFSFHTTLEHRVPSNSYWLQNQRNLEGLTITVWEGLESVSFSVSLEMQYRHTTTVLEFGEWTHLKSVAYGLLKPNRNLIAPRKRRTAVLWNYQVVTSDGHRLAWAKGYLL